MNAIFEIFINKKYFLFFDEILIVMQLNFLFVLFLNLNFKFHPFFRKKEDKISTTKI